MPRLDKRLIMILWMVLAAVGSCNAQVYEPNQMVNPNVENRYKFVCDPAHLLDATTTDGVNRRLYDLRQTTTCEVAVIVVPSIGDTPIEDWCEQVFTRWGIGKGDKDNGALLLIAVDDHKTRIQTGYGVEGVLTDIACNNIIGETIVPNMRDGNLNAAVDQSTQLISDALTDPAVAEELRSSQADNYSGSVSTLDKEVIWEFVRIVAGFVFLLALALFAYDLWSLRRKNGYDKARTWRGHLTTFAICGILSLGTGIIFWLLALWLYRSNRNRRLKCPTCGSKMNRLNEEEDNNYLSDSQDFEEQLKTVDYDVWVCPTCGTIERFPYAEKQTKYSKCPACGTVAMRLVKDIITRPATTRHDGEGVKIYECEFCHHQEQRKYRIPKKDDDGLAAAAILGAAAGRRGGGGFGGGFGGGATGGGGASGSW